MNNYIIKPVITEKSMKLATSNKFSFIVSKNINKIIIAQAIKDRYNVEVLSVNIVKTPRKPKNKLTKKRGTTKPKIKAIVTLKKGQTIPGYELTQEQPVPENNTKEKSKTKNK